MELTASALTDLWRLALDRLGGTLGLILSTVIQAHIDMRDQDSPTVAAGPLKPMFLLTSCTMCLRRISSTFASPVADPKDVPGLSEGLLELGSSLKIELGGVGFEADLLYDSLKGRGWETISSENDRSSFDSKFSCRLCDEFETSTFHGPSNGSLNSHDRRL